MRATSNSLSREAAFGLTRFFRFALSWRIDLEKRRISSILVATDSKKGPRRRVTAVPFRMRTYGETDPTAGRSGRSQGRGCIFVAGPSCYRVRHNHADRNKSKPER